MNTNAYQRIKHPNAILLVVGCLVALGMLASTIYLPSMPAMVTYFNTSNGYIQSTFTIYVLAYACSQFIYGPLSDYYGRRIIMISSLIIFVVGCIFSSLSSSIEMLLIGSCIQGAGMGCSSTMARAVIRDLTTSNHALQKAATLITIPLVVMPIIAPIIGGYIQEYLFWQIHFIMLAVIGLIALSAILCTIETNLNRKIGPVLLREIIGDYLKIGKNKDFLIYASFGLFVIAAEVCYEVFVPFLLQGEFHLNPVEYGWVSACPFIGYIIGSFLATYVHKRYSLTVAIMIGFIISGLAGVGMLGEAFFLTQKVWSIIFLMTVAMLGFGIVFPCAIAGAMSSSSTVGSTAAALGGGQNFGASLMGGLITLLPSNHVGSLASFLIICSVIPLIIFLLCVMERESSCSPKFNSKKREIALEP